MALSSTNAVNEIAAALGNSNSRIVWDKASIANAAAGQIFSLWRATGTPGQGAIPAAAALCTSALTGAMGFTNQTAPVTSYYAWQSIGTGNAATSVEVHDRLAHMGGLNGTLTTAQTVGVDLTSGGLNLPAARRGDANYSDVQWWLEWYTDTGATASNATVAVTYDDGSTGNLAAIAVGGTVRAGRMIPLVSAVTGRFIRAVTSVTLSASTGTAGSFGVTATRPRTVVNSNIANKTEQFDWAQLGLPEIPNDSCLMMVMLCSTTSTGTVRGQGKIIHA
jgi:3',5'-cyclic AMP phosphodiesterase CpdA